MDLICQKSKRKFESKPKHKIETVIIKIYTRILCTDVEYKTLSIDNKTTCKEIVQMILKKFRLQHRDSNLFYLTLEAWIKQTEGFDILSLCLLRIMIINRNAVRVEM
ncbi:Ras association (RalGDS/AF-6) domain containing protein [Sarcoptes scabiei]|uniref:Ras association (RalGDS/AF-6) domain containing protein n=1 Tax=Sarcoptes scabiei TaxID=52283 RepID=A0A132AI21_SARSC|nr:Ras association (RalGDS/AF-6) domain containing protein [Sarcoptes scabiei]